MWLHKASSLEAFLPAPIPAVSAFLGPVSQCSAPAQAKMIDASATKQTPVWPGKDGWGGWMGWIGWMNGWMDCSTSPNGSGSPITLCAVW